jgi:VIT1/CCC1 family predicted Fe2+/Mn2+ transporter
MKKYVLLLPEFILLCITAYWFIDNFTIQNHFNPYAFGVFVVLLLQVFFQNKFVGFLLATLISLFSLYMVLAVISEFNDFPTASAEAFQLLSFGLLLCFLGISSAIALFYKLLPKIF